MREIKFRVWNKTRKEMLFNVNLPCDFNSESGDGIWMQYTGLKDKNGKEIFEGDILQNSMQTGNAFYIIEWWDARFRPIFYNHGERVESMQYSPLYLGTGDDLVIIGNIYENPELLNQSTQ